MHERQTISRRDASGGARRRSLLRIAARFQGWAGTAHGGYLAGLLARELDGPSEITFLRPVPIEAPHWLRVGPLDAELCDRRGALVTAVRTEPSVSPPPPVSFDRASDAVERAVRVGLPHVVVGLAAGSEGRKRFAETAIYDPDDRLCAVARSVWFPMR